MVTDASDQRAFAALTLNVIDENDNIPQFLLSNIEASVPVDSRPGESIFMVNCLLSNNSGLKGLKINQRYLLLLLLLSAFLNFMIKFIFCRNRSRLSEIVLVRLKEPSHQLS